MNNKEILARNESLIKDNPEAVHKSVYFTKKEAYTSDLEYRSIADIEEIEALKAENEGLKSRAEICEKIFSDSPDLTFKECLKLFPDEFSRLETQQQVKGIREAVSKSITPAIANWPDDEYHSGFMDCTTAMLKISTSLTKQSRGE